MSFHLRSALIDVEHALQAEMLGLPLELTGAHVRLLVLASYLADGGRIAGSRKWSPTEWLRWVGFRPRYLFPRLEAAGLIRWEGEDLVVLHYILNHEKRIRTLATVRCPEMWAARSQYRVVYQGGATPPPARGSVALPKDRVNCAKVLRTPPLVQGDCTRPLPNELTPDPRSLLEGDIPSDRRPDHPFEEGSEPPGPPPHEDRARVSSSGGSEAHLRPRDAGPEGFEAFLAAMPVPKERQPRDPRVWPKWIDRMLRHWVREDLEGEAPEILGELERQKNTEQWRKRPWTIPSGIIFLRAASWRRRRPAKPRPKPAAAAEVLADASDSWKGSTPTTREELEAFVRGVINAREHHS